MSTNSEIDSGVSGGKAIARVISSSGAFSHKVLTKESSYTGSSFTQAQFRDWQSYDSGVYADIWVRTAASSAQSVSTTGSPSVKTESGVTSYSYSGTTSGNMNVHTYNGNGATVENNNYTSAYTVTYKVSSFTYGQIINGVYIPDGNGGYKKLSGNWYQNASYSKSTLTVTGTDTGSGSATLVFTPKGQTWYSGTVSVTPYTPEKVARKVFQPASYSASSYTQEKTGDEKWNYYTYVPSSGTPTTKNFLVPSAATATQNFAFDMDDYE